MQGLEHDVKDLLLKRMATTKAGHPQSRNTQTNGKQLVSCDSDSDSSCDSSSDRDCKMHFPVADLADSADEFHAGGDEAHEDKGPPRNPRRKMVGVYSRSTCPGYRAAYAFGRMLMQCRSGCQLVVAVEHHILLSQFHQAVSKIDLEQIEDVMRAWTEVIANGSISEEQLGLRVFVRIYLGSSEQHSRHNQVCICCFSVFLFIFVNLLVYCLLVGLFVCLFVCLLIC